MEQDMKRIMRMQAVKLFKEVLNLQGITIRVRNDFSLDSTTLAQVADMGGWFDISVNPMVKSERKAVELIAHEMTHVKQFVHDKLDLEKCSFKGDEYTMECDMDYWFAPWEIEARGMEQALWAYYCENYSAEL